jgi:DNA polymerase (family 10)
MKNSEVARVFDDIADLLELKNENVFKVRAYQKVARSIEHLPVEIEQLVAEERLGEVPGVGEAIHQKITELITTGKLDYYEKLKSEFPAGVSVLLTVPGVGPKKALLLTRELNIKTIDDLEEAIRSGKVADLPRMGEKTADNILRQIQSLRKKDQRIPIGEALPIVDDIFAGLKNVPGVKNLTAAGSLRRFRETVGDIDLMGTADNPEEVIQAFTGLSRVKQVLASGTTKASVVVAGGLQVDLRIVEHDSFGSTLQYFTGSKQHNINLRTKMLRQKLSLSEYGITDLNTQKLEKFATEEAFYKRLGLGYIPPEIREGTDEIERAEQGTLPRLVELSDIKGDLHVHSDWSEGQESIEAMALAAKERGYQYIGIADHSRGRGIAHGLDVERLRRQIAEIKQLNHKISGIRILAGMEVDIRADGTLDMPDEVLSELDIVTASVHSGLTQDEKQMTGRIIRAIENPNVDVLAHPTGRILPGREPVSVDIESVFKAAAKNKKIMEINAMPSRLDLNDIHAFRARELGVRLVISTDAHASEHLGYMRFGVGVARRAWCEAKDILNTRPLAEFISSLKV